MTSSPRKTPLDDLPDLHFCWDHTAPQNLDQRLEYPDSVKRFEAYLDLLSEVKPSLNELLDVKIFDEPFTLD